MSVEIKDKMPIFRRSMYDAVDLALKDAARDTLVNAKIKAPHDKGALRSNTDAKQVKTHHWRVSFWEEYARYQEFGGDGKRRVRNYTTAGTGKAYLKTAGDQQRDIMNYKFRKYLSRVRV